MPKKKKETPDSEWQRYAGAQMEEMKSMMQAVLESTAPISHMQEQIGSMQEQIGSMQEQITYLTTKVDAIENTLQDWESDIKLISVMFNEVGKQRMDVEVLKEETRKIRQEFDQLVRQGKLSPQQYTHLAQRLEKIEQTLTRQ